MKLNESEKEVYINTVLELSISDSSPKNLSSKIANDLNEKNITKSQEEIMDRMADFLIAARDSYK